MALSYEEYAKLAARHGCGQGQALRQDINRDTGKTRQQEWLEAGISSETQAKALCEEIRKAPDTRCYLGHRGREVYANDRLNAIYIINVENPHLSTIFPNNHPTLSATKRLENRAQQESETKELPCVIRIGGASALEIDRQALMISKNNIVQDVLPRHNDLADRPRSQARVLKEAQDKQRESPEQKLSHQQRRFALEEASVSVAKEQQVLKKAWEAEGDPRRKEQIALKAGIEQADFDRQAARERADLTAQENGPQSIEALRAKKEVKAADKAYDQGVAEWHKRSVRDRNYERFNKKWSKEAERAEARETKSKDSQEKKNTALDRQFNPIADYGSGHGM